MVSIDYIYARPGEYFKGYQFNNGVTYALSIDGDKSKVKRILSPTKDLYEHKVKWGKKPYLTGATAIKYVEDDFRGRTVVQGFNLGKRGQLYLSKGCTGFFWWPLEEKTHIFVDSKGKIKKLSSDAMHSLVDKLGMKLSQLEPLARAPENYMKVLRLIFRGKI